MATTKNKDKFNFTRTDLYTARKNLTYTELSIWMYLADGNEYNKKEIAKLNGITERTVERAYITFKSKGYVVNNVFTPVPSKKKTSSTVVQKSSLIAVPKPKEKEVVKVETTPVEEPVVRRWIDQF